MFIIKTVIAITLIWIVFFLLKEAVRSNQELNACNQDCNQGRRCDCGKAKDEQE